MGRKILNRFFFRLSPLACYCAIGGGVALSVVSVAVVVRIISLHTTHIVRARASHLSFVADFTASVLLE